MLIRFCTIVLWIGLMPSSFAGSAFHIVKERQFNTVNGVVVSGMQTSHYYSNTTLLGSMTESLNAVSITVPEGTQKRVFKSAADFSAADQNKYPYEFSVFSGMPPADRAAKLALLQQYDPNGLHVFNALKHKLVFDYASKPEREDILDSIESIFTGVHESVHQLAMASVEAGVWTYHYPLVDGSVATARRDNAFPLQKLFESLPVDRQTVGIGSRAFEQIYLQSSQSFNVLIDELNAYSQEGLTRIRVLKGLQASGHKLSIEKKNGEQNTVILTLPQMEDGIPILMVFMAEYLHLAKKSYLQSWERIHARDRNALAAILNQAESVLHEVCVQGGIDEKDRILLEYAYQPQFQEAFKEVLGETFQFHPPVDCM